MTKRRKKGTKKPDARPVPPAVTRPAPDAQARESDPIIGYDPGDGREWHELPSGVPVDFFPISTRTDVVQVEIDGLGVTPETVDTMAMLRIAETYLALTLKLADAKRAPFLLTGLRILDKCVAVESVPNDMQRAVFFCGMAASTTILGRDFPPDALKQVRDANGLVLHYYKYDAMILAVGVRYHVDCVVTEDDRQANMAVLAKLTVRKPDYFQASQLQLVP
jgi:hypothetical protein